MEVSDGIAIKMAINFLLFLHTKKNFILNFKKIYKLKNKNLEISVSLFNHSRCPPWRGDNVAVFLTQSVKESH